MKYLFQWVYVAFLIAFAVMLAITGIFFKIGQYALFGSFYRQVGAWAGICLVVVLYWIFKQPSFINNGMCFSALAFFSGVTVFCITEQNRIEK